MTSPHVVGDDVDAICTRCKLELNHTILAMVGARIARVRCNTCQGEHAYHSSSTGESKRRAATTRAPKAAAKSAANDLDELLEGRDIANAHRYKLSELFTKGEVIDHPTFGVGVVVDVRGDRFDAVFREGVKTLAQRKVSSTFSKHEHHHPPPPAEDEEPVPAATEG